MMIDKQKTGVNEDQSVKTRRKSVCKQFWMGGEKCVMTK